MRIRFSVHTGAFRMIIYLYETLSTALSSFAYLSKQSHHLLKHGLMANYANCHELVDRGARSLPYRG
jgi:hypothetical protein